MPDLTLMVGAGGMAAVAASTLFVLNRRKKMKADSNGLDIADVSYDKQSNKMRVTFANVGKETQQIAYTAIRQKAMLDKKLPQGMMAGNVAAREQYFLLGEKTQEFTLQPNDMVAVEYQLLPNAEIDLTQLDIEIDGIRIKYEPKGVEPPAPQPYVQPYTPPVADDKLERKFSDASSSWDLQHLTAVPSFATPQAPKPPKSPEPVEAPKTMQTLDSLLSAATGKVTETVTNPQAGASLAAFAEEKEKPLQTPAVASAPISDPIYVKPEPESTIPGLYEISLNKNVMMLVKGKDLQISRVIGEITHEVYLGKVLKLNIRLKKVYGGHITPLTSTYMHEGWVEKAGNMLLLPEELGPSISYSEE